MAFLAMILIELRTQRRARTFFFGPQIRKFLGSICNSKYANFLGVPVRKSQICTFVMIIRKLQIRRFPWRPSPQIANPQIANPQMCREKAVFLNQIHIGLPLIPFSFTNVRIF
jgi:hypothetical protein